VGQWTVTLSTAKSFTPFFFGAQFVFCTFSFCLTQRNSAPMGAFLAAQGFLLAGQETFTNDGTTCQDAVLNRRLTWSRLIGVVY
jgi:hypothetical protein